MVDARAVLARRRAERDRLLALAGEFTDQLDPALEVRAVVVFGSVARGDFNVWSDTDVLVVADALPSRWLDRYGVLPVVAGVQVIAWTPAEWTAQRRRRNPIVEEALSTGVWLRGAAAEFEAV